MAPPRPGHIDTRTATDDPYGTKEDPVYCTIKKGVMPKYKFEAGKITVEEGSTAHFRIEM